MNLAADQQAPREVDDEELNTTLSIDCQVSGLKLVLRDPKSSLSVALSDLKVAKNPEDTVVSLGDLVIKMDDRHELLLKHSTHEGFRASVPLVEIKHMPDCNELTLNDAYAIIDLKSYIKIAQLAKTFKAQLMSIRGNVPAQEQVDQPQPRKEAHLRLQVVDSYVELAAREGKNSLFFLVDSLDLRKR